SPLQKSDDVVMRVDAPRHDNGKAPELLCHFLYRRQEIFKPVRLDADLLQFESQVAPSEWSFEHDGVRPVAQSFPFFTYDFKGPGRRDDGNQACLARLLDSGKTERQSRPRNYDVGAGVNGAFYGIIIVLYQGNHDVDTRDTTLRLCLGNLRESRF